MKERHFDSLNVKEIIRVITEDPNAGSIIAIKLKRKEWWEIDVSAAYVAITLSQFKVVADGVYLANKLPEMMGDTAQASQSILKVLSKAFEELGRDEKHMLLPLFFSFDMQTAKSFFIEDRELRDRAFNAFKKLNSKGLSISELKTAYFAFNPWHKEMTHHGDIFNLNERAFKDATNPTPKNAETTVSDKVSPDAVSEKNPSSKDPSVIEERLKRLKMLYTKNLISKSVYEEKQRDIISEI